MHDSGGNLDISIITAHNGIYETKATSGDTHLGGEDLNNKLLEHVLNIASKKGFTLDDNRRAIMRLYLQCELAKIQLSSETAVLKGKDDTAINKILGGNQCSFVGARERLPNVD